MAKALQFTDQFAVVSTPDHNDLLATISADPRIADSKSLVVRVALDLLFDTLGSRVRGVEGIAADVVGHARITGSKELDPARKEEALAALRATPEYAAIVERVIAHIDGSERLSAVTRETAAL